MKNPFAIAVHGGAGTILKSTMTPEKELLYKQGLTQAIEAGNALLSEGKSSLDAVEAAVIALENFPLFNAGKGAVFTNKGTHEMDASIMNGQTLEAGAVSGISKIKNPIALARVIMDKSGHVFLAGTDAEMFAQQMGFAFEPETYFFEETRFKQWQEVKDSHGYQLDHSGQHGEGKKFGTVGAVAIDQYGNLAAATSTGGMTNKRFGRIGDSPVIGAGTYANNQTCAISCTGHGEYFIRAVVAYDISCLMEYKGYTLKQACDYVVKDKLVKFGGEGGLIAIDKFGNIELPFNSEGMYRACKKNGEETVVKIYED
ncbi:MAG: isoaspartyl peptidase/L-asparaginase [Bacteroidia bacterium]|jgi:beta-aspartyl-peptidase (threonine type)|nr:isoaspartyl peptidase/L-asparaginase [Bacteroidia bacterium]